jgi:hypothetical protein
MDVFDVFAEVGLFAAALLAAVPTVLVGSGVDFMKPFRPKFYGQNRICKSLGMQLCMKLPMWLYYALKS